MAGGRSAGTGGSPGSPRTRGAPAKGLAAFASRALGKDEFIGEYAGEVVDLRSKDNRTAT